MRLGEKQALYSKAYDSDPLQPYATPEASANMSKAKNTAKLAVLGQHIFT